MDWSNERYVRLYTRDTVDWLLLSWQARALFTFLIRKADRSGVIDGKAGARGLSVLVSMPLHDLEPALAELEADGCVVAGENRYLLVNFMEAQECIKGDALRAKEYRERRRHDALDGVTKTTDPVTLRDDPVTKSDATVTARHEASRSVTPSRSDPIRSDPLREPRFALDPEIPDPEKPTKARGKSRSALPADWVPNEQHREMAQRLRLDVTAQAQAFRDYGEAHGKIYASHDAAFRTWLNNAPKFQRAANGGVLPFPQPPTRLPRKLP